MCQVNGCEPPDLPTRTVHVTIPGHMDADVDLCDGHAALYERERYLGGLIVPDGTWAEYLEQHGPVTQG